MKQCSWKSIPVCRVGYGKSVTLPDNSTQARNNKLFVPLSAESSDTGRMWWSSKTEAFNRVVHKIQAPDKSKGKDQQEDYCRPIVSLN